jgi:hypothetical protein
MWQDPIVKETRELREEYAEKFNHDPDAIFEDITPTETPIYTQSSLTNKPDRAHAFRARHPDAHG